MGRIKTKLIKRTGNLLFKTHKKKFDTDFDHNKKAVEQVVTMPSKKMRNVLAGYLTRLVRIEQERKR